MDFSKFSEYGLIGLIIGVLFFFLWRMLIWVMTFIKEITERHERERIRWQETYDKQIDTLNKISNNIDEHDKRADERGRYVREEHKQMVEILGRINGYTK